ncbi:MAG TPA: CDP-alcohol phosphatidyltransferase family protein [Gemmatimonadaceae bacterium]|nr:CDP-alcohol phosphatidyltransferase family protein [Gemmatimonadaceae bacterium]
MFDDALRAFKDRLLWPFAVAIGTRISPNAVTLAAFLVGLIAATLAARGDYGAALGAWLLNRILDGVDGTLARATEQQSDFGGYLDIVLDFAVYAAVPIGLVVAVQDRLTALLGAALLGAFFVNGASWMYLAAILERRGEGAAALGERTTIRMPAGLIAGTETVVLYSLFLILPAKLPLLFTLMMAGVVITIVQRLIWARRNL